MSLNVSHDRSRSRFLGRHLLFFTRLSFQPELLESNGSIAELAGQLQLVEDMPFFVTGDGQYPLDDLNDFFRSLPSDGCHSPHTWRAYARDIDAYLTFLHDVYRIHWLDAKNEHLTHYWEVRRGDQAEKLNLKIGSSSWNRALVALDRLYRFAVEEGWIDTAPFRYRDLSSRTDPRWTMSSVRRNLLRDPDRQTGDTIRCITLEEYRIFRDVGLRGLLPDGTPDGSVDRRHSIRDALFADLLIETGLRVTEAAGQVVWEVPAPALLTGSGSVECHLAPAIAKGRRSRKFRLHRRLIRRLHEYIEIERANLLGTGGVRVDGLLARRTSFTDFVHSNELKRRKIGEASLEVRRRLVELLPDGSAQPVALWIGEHGAMLSPDRWRDIFAAASQRCTSLGFPMDVSPHTLRHTFAVSMLERLIRAVLSKTDQDQLADSPGAQAYRRLIGDPLRQLQRMLGHRSITTTYRYLTHLDEAVEISLRAYDDLHEDLHQDKEAR